MARLVWLCQSSIWFESQETKASMRIGSPSVCSLCARGGGKALSCARASASSNVLNEQDLHTSHVRFVTKLLSAAYSVS